MTYWRLADGVVNPAETLIAVSSFDCLSSILVDEGRSVVVIRFHCGDQGQQRLNPIRESTAKSHPGRADRLVKRLNPAGRQREANGRCGNSRSAQKGEFLFHGLCGEKVTSRRALIRSADIFALITSIVKSSSGEDGSVELAGNQARRPTRVEYSGEAEDRRGKNR